MKISYADYITKSNVSVLVSEAIFNELEKKYPLKKIQEIAETTSGGTPTRGNFDYYGGNIPWYKSGELNDGLIDSAEEYITEKGLKNSSAKLHPKGTLLVALYGATVGKTGITQIEAATNQALCAIFPKQEVERDYLFWFFRSHRFKFIEMSKGGAQPNISQTIILNTKIPVPPKDVQVKIISILENTERTKNYDQNLIPDEYKNTINKVFFSKNSVKSIETELTHQLTLVKQLRQQLLQDAVQGKLVAQHSADEPASELLKRIKAEKEQLVAEKNIKLGKKQEAVLQDELLFEIPCNWEWCSLDDITKNITDGTHQTPIYTKNGRIFLSAQNIKPFRFMPEEHKLVSEETYNEIISNRRPEKGDILIARVGAGIGEAAVINQDIDFCFYVSLGLIQPFRNLINSEYIALVINSPYGVKYAKGNISSKGGSAGNYNLGRIRSFLIPLPPLSEQARIVQKLDELMQMCNALEDSIRQSAAQNEKLLQQVLREALRKE